MWRLLAFVAVLLWPLAARAAVVTEISTLDAAGRWILVDSTPRAALIRDEARLPLRKGDEVQLGDRVLTDEARVRVDLGGGQDLSVREHSEVELHDRSVLQRLGDVYYRVKGAFQVEYGTVQTSVEGTEFAVSGGDEVQVTVAEGRVRVRNPDGEIRLRRWQQGTMPAAGAGAVAFAPEAARAVVQQSFRRGAPLVQVGLLLSGGLANGGGAVQGRLFGRVLIAGPLRLGIDVGIGSNGLEPGFRTPAGLGLDLAFGGVSVGGQLAAALELDRLGCGGCYAAVHLGGVGALRYQLPLSRSFSLQGEVRGGWVDGVVADGALGLGLSW